MREFIERFSAFFKKSGHESDLDAEMKAHLAFAIDENIAAGLTPDEARRRALIRFGRSEARRDILINRERQMRFHLSVQIAFVPGFLEERGEPLDKFTHRV